jgi:hypothetical protein
MVEFEGGSAIGIGTSSQPEADRPTSGHNQDSDQVEDSDEMDYSDALACLY